MGYFVSTRERIMTYVIRTLALCAGMCCQSYHRKTYKAIKQQNGGDGQRKMPLQPKSVRLAREPAVR